MDVTILVFHGQGPGPAFLLSWTDAIEPVFPPEVPERVRALAIRSPGSIGFVDIEGKATFRPATSTENDHLRAALRVVLSATTSFDFGCTTGQSPGTLVLVRGSEHRKLFGGQYEVFADSFAFIGPGATEWADFSSLLLKFADVPSAAWPCLTAGHPDGASDWHLLG